MINWIISISVITILTSLLLTLLPENEKSGIVKFVFSLIIILVIIKPGISKDDFYQIFDKTETNEIQLQEDFLDYYSNKKVAYIKNQCNIICNEEGVKGAVIIVDIDDKNIQNNMLTSININFLNATFTKNLEKSISIENIKKKIKEMFNVKLEMVY